MDLKSILTRLDRLSAAAATPTGPPVPIIPDGLPLPRWARCMSSEEVGAEVERLQRGEPSPYTLTPAQQAELDARFEASGGVARVEQMQRDLLAAERGQP